MDGLYAAYGDFVLKLCLLGIAAIATGVAFVVIVREVKRYAKTLRRVGFVQSLLLGTFIYGMIREGVITQDDKEEYRDAMAPIMEERAAMARILLPSDDDDLARRNDSSKSEDGLNALTREFYENADASGPDRNLRDATQEIAESDYEAGIVLAEVRTNEVHDFTAPTNAIWQQDWMNFGGFSDNFRLELEGLTFPFGTNSISALTVFQRGLMRPRTVVASSFIAPMQARLGAVPAYRHSLLPEANRPSGFWHCFTPSNSVVMTWRNFLLGQDALCPVTLQAELFEDGCAEFRYDLSQAGAETITNIVAGIRCNSLGMTLDSLDANVTTIRWQRLNPEDVANPDPDGDGISTCDEIFVYRTDPYNADTDYDGLSDYDEINVYNSDPTNAHSQGQAFCDSVALAIGDEDPHACPPGSTNTVFEHVFYAGTTNAPFAYPLSTDDAALLRISVSGSGSGEMVIGDEVVPLLAPPQMRSGPSTNTLLKSIGRGVVKRLWFRKPEGLDVSLASDDFMIGELPNPLKFYGWLAFPHTNATPACIHDLNAKGTHIALEHGEEVPGLSALWSCASHDVAVTNRPPVGAELYGSFSTRQSREVAYTLSHPDYLAGQTTFLQTLRFCPQLDDEDEASTAGFPDGVTTNMCHCVEPGGIVCGCCAYGSCNCPNPECPCYGNPSIAPDETAEEDAEDEYDATMALPEALNVLQLHGSVATQNVVHLDVPGEYRKCCSCPDHWTNHVALAYSSQRLSVTDSSGECFSVTNIDCNVIVRGLEPSIAPFGDVALFSTNGASYLSRRYTALGVRMNSPCGYDTSVYNALSPSFGVPVTVNTNLMNAARFELHTDILLSNGLVRVALENATCGAQVWLPEYTVWRFDDNDMWLENHPPVLLLDADTMPERYFTIRQWRSIMRNRGSDRTQPLMVVSPAAGHLDFVFSYATAHGDHAIKTGIRQRVTFVNPPLVADYDRDGSVGTNDVNDAVAMRPVYFWVNDDKWRGDNAFETYLLRNSSNNVIDGRNDLINFLPIAVDIAQFASHWNSSEVDYRLETASPALQNANLAFTDIDWSQLGDAPLGNNVDICGNAIHEAPVSVLGSATNLPSAFVSLSQSGSSTLLMEFPEAARHHNLYLNIYAKSSNERLFSKSIELHIGDVAQMIGWENLRSAAGGSDGLPTRLATDDWPAAEHKPGNVVFVHGYNMAEDAEAPLWAKNVFKKLWWSGLDRGFVAVQWCGNEGQTYIPGIGFTTPNYYGNVQNAFKTAPALSNAMQNVQGPKWFLAHSLGNMLVSAAIQDCGMPYERYFMLNAAIALEAFDPVSGITSQSHDSMTPCSWTNYIDKVRATHWFERFSEGDGRRLLTWKGRFSNVTSVVNFYSSEEEVVNNGDGEPHNLLDRNYVWYNQETRKGLWPMMLHEYEGGWEFNPYHDTVTGSYVGNEYVEHRQRMSPQTAADLTDEQLRQHPFFLDFANPEMHTSSNGLIVATNYLYRAEMLAYAIPSESFAIGGNPLPQLVETDLNFNMAAEFSYGREDLPENGVKTTEMHRNWQHSTFVQRSYKRTHQLFRTIINLLKEGEEE